MDFSTLKGLTIPEGVVTQITDASGRVLWSVAPALINFTIGGNAYQAEEGMTWTEWCNSEYNENKLHSYYESGQVYHGYTGMYVQYNSKNVTSQDVIVDGRAYTYLT